MWTQDSVESKRSLRVNLRKLPRICSGCRFVLEKRKVTITYNQRSWWMHPFFSCFTITIYTLLLLDIRFTDSTRIYACQSHMNRQKERNMNRRTLQFVKKQHKKLTLLFNSQISTKLLIPKKTKFPLKRVKKLIKKQNKSVNRNFTSSC